MNQRSILEQVSIDDPNIKTADQAVANLAAWSATTLCSDIGFVLPIHAVEELSPRAQEICQEAIKGMFQTCLPAVIMYAWGRRDTARTLSLPSIPPFIE